MAIRSIAVIESVSIVRANRRNTVNPKDFLPRIVADYLVVAGGGSGGKSGRKAGGGGGGVTSGTDGNGVVNTGGGGGGTEGNQNAKPGGSGIAIIRYANTYPDATSTTGSPTFSQSGGFKRYIFTGSGSITF